MQRQSNGQFKSLKKQITKSYRFPSNCFFRAPVLPIKLLSLSKSDASCSRTSNSFSPCNFFKTREDIFIALPIQFRWLIRLNLLKKFPFLFKFGSTQSAMHDFSLIEFKKREKNNTQKHSGPNFTPSHSHYFALNGKFSLFKMQWRIFMLLFFLH